MSTQSSLPNLESSSWKKEVNRQVAAHRSRKGLSVAEVVSSSEPRHEADSLAAQAAARVAARYATVPSYSAMLVEEECAAQPPAETSIPGECDAPTAIPSSTAGLKTAASAEFELESQDLFAPELEAVAAEKPTIDRSQLLSNLAPPVDAQPTYAILWDATMPARLAKTARAENGFELPVTERRRTQRDDFRDEFQEIAVVEPEQPIHANLIEFPRELVAARRARPRLAEGPLGASAEQLSIFEVDPGAICTEPDSTKSVTAASSRLPEWSGMELEAQPIAETEIEAEPASALALARISRRLMAAVVDGALIVGGCLAATLVAIAGMKTPIAAREAELAAIVALAALGALYQAFFFTLGKATPGMKYAGISLCTFNDEQPTRARLFARLGALPLSLAPLGLGVLWILFDEDRLSWHDRISRTYQREC